jgi:hypothetical protein
MEIEVQVSYTLIGDTHLLLHIYSRKFLNENGVSLTLRSFLNVQEKVSRSCWAI